MARIGQLNLNWPWKLLLGEQAPGPFAVPKSVQPVLPIDGNTYPANIQSFSQTVALLLGANEITLPRGPDQGRVRLWSYLTIQFDILTAGLIVNFQFRDLRAGVFTTLVRYPAGRYDVNSAAPLIGSCVVDPAAAGPPTAAHGIPKLFIPGIQWNATIRITGAAGTETAIVNGHFTEADENMPLFRPLP